MPRCRSVRLPTMKPHVISAAGSTVAPRPAMLCPVSEAAVAEQVPPGVVGHEEHEPQRERRQHPGDRDPPLQLRPLERRSGR